MEQVARELLRQIRGKRSQEAFSRRLGYSSNPVADWEAGRRFPTAGETLRAAEVAGIALRPPFESFATAECPAPVSFDDAGVAQWLDGLRGNTPVSHVAEAVGRTRSCTSRWLSGATRPRLPDFLRLISALTGRLEAWVAAMVDIEGVPSLWPTWHRKQLARRLALEHPWTEAMLRLMETEAYRALPKHEQGWLAERLGIPLSVELTGIEHLQEAGIIAAKRGRFVALRPLTLDTGTDPDAIWAVKEHWIQAAAARIRHRGPDDLYSYNVVSVSHADLARLRALHLQYFQDVRAIVSASEPVETAALVLTQLIELE